MVISQRTLESKYLKYKVCHVLKNHLNVCHFLRGFKHEQSK